MRALFVGGMVDNSEMDLEGTQPPLHYPENGGGGHSRYRLHQLGRREDGSIACAVYGAPDLTAGEIERISDERGYARRFEADIDVVEH